jgi:hypothetical protein
MKSNSIKGKSPEEIQTELDKSLQDGFKPNLAIVFYPSIKIRKLIVIFLIVKDLPYLGQQQMANLSMMSLKKIQLQLFY